MKISAANAVYATFTPVPMKDIWRAMRSDASVWPYSILPVRPRATTKTRTHETTQTTILKQLNTHTHTFIHIGTCSNNQGRLLSGTKKRLRQDRNGKNNLKSWYLPKSAQICPNMLIKTDNTKTREHKEEKKKREDIKFIATGLQLPPRRWTRRPPRHPACRRPDRVPVRVHSPRAHETRG